MSYQIQEHASLVELSERNTNEFQIELCEAKNSLSVQTAKPCFGEERFFLEGKKNHLQYHLISE